MYLRPARAYESSRIQCFILTCFLINMKNKIKNIYLKHSFNVDIYTYICMLIITRFA